MRPLSLAAAGGLFAGLVAAQDPRFDAWLRASHPDALRADARTVLDEARAQGLVRGPGDVLELKLALRRLQLKDRRASADCKRLDSVSAAAPPPEGAPDTVTEVETNDGWQYADDTAGASAVAGDCSGPDDVDSFRFASTGAFWSFTVVGTGPLPVVDSTLMVRNDRGDPVAFNDNAGGLLSALKLWLPAGTFYLEVASVNGLAGGTYELRIGSEPANVHAAPGAGTTRAPMGGAAHDVFAFTVPDSRVDLRVASGQDTVLLVQRADGVIVFRNDDSSAGGLDAAADVDLPAGTYFAYVSELSGLAGVPFTLAMTSAPATFPDLCAGPATGTLLGNESLRLHRLVLTAPQRAATTTTAGPVVPVGDTILILFDPTFDYLLDVDDDDPGDPARGYYSRIVMDLPAATYLVGVMPFPQQGPPGLAGDYAVGTVCSAYAPTGTARFGASPAAIAGHGQVNTYLLQNGTQVTTRFRASDFYFGVLDGTGELASCQLGSPFFPQGGEVLGGTSTVFVFDRYDYQGPLNLAFEPSLFRDAQGSVATHAKEGDLLFLLAEFGFLAPPFNFGVGDRGFLLLPQTPYLVTFGVRVAPSGGLSVWWTPPPGTLVLNLQLGDVHTGAAWPAPALGTWRNVLQL
jgi:hypothetical protein